MESNLRSASIKSIIAGARADYEFVYAEDLVGEHKRLLRDCAEYVLAVIENNLSRLTLPTSVLATINEKCDLQEKLAEAIRLNNELSTSLGKALGYPEQADDEQCIDDKSLESLASEAAVEIAQLKRKQCDQCQQLLARIREVKDAIGVPGMSLGQCARDAKRRIQMLESDFKAMVKERDEARKLCRDTRQRGHGNDAVASVIDLLNTAFHDDPNAMHAIMAMQIPCNRQLAEHPLVQVRQNKVINQDVFTVSPIGIINGIMLVLGLKPVASQFSGPIDELPRLQGFSEWSGPPSEIPGAATDKRSMPEPVNVNDSPELDATDAAHPAWWRGHDHTAKVFCQLVNEILDGKDVSSGISGEPWQATKMRLSAVAKQGRPDDNEPLTDGWSRQVMGGSYKFDTDDDLEDVSFIGWSTSKGSEVGPSIAYHTDDGQVFLDGHGVPGIYVRTRKHLRDLLRPFDLLNEEISSRKNGDA